MEAAATAAQNSHQQQHQQQKHRQQQQTHFAPSDAHWVLTDEASFSVKNSNHSHINNDATTSGWKAINATHLC
jgi:hypothetical protein